MDKRSAIEPNDMQLSFVIPTRNEEKHLARCIQSIKQLSGIRDYEIIVVDNGSTDNTVKIAENAGVRVLSKHNCHVGAVRNFGAQSAKGTLLCFIDADCEILEDWLKCLQSHREELLAGKIGALGADYVNPPDSNLIQRSWFTHQKRNFVGSANIIPAGNMILSKKTFLSIGGFNEEITSGEDYELCERLKTRGFLVYHDYHLLCLHYGNPSTIQRFYKRERWHGRGMIADLKHPLRSKPLLMSSVYVLSYIAGVVILLLSIRNSQAFLLLPFLLIPTLLPPIYFSLLRSSQSAGLQYFPVLCFLYVIYCFARSLSLIEILFLLARRPIMRRRLKS